MQILCIIPARGGSKGIPKKNIRIIAGKPLLAWTIEQAKSTPAISRVIVTTDSPEIAEVAKGYGAEVVARPNEISGDTASSETALLHALDHVSSASGADPDLIVFLQSTSPLRRPDDIGEAIATLIRENADSLFSACRVEGFIWRRMEDRCVASFSYDHSKRPRRQDAPEDFVENGAIYVFKPWVLRQHQNRLGGKIAIHRMSPVTFVQIDEPDDFALLATIMETDFGRNLITKEGKPATPHSVIGRCEQKVRLLVLDFDGVMTNNLVVVSETGEESVVCSREDGLGLEMLRRGGTVEILVLSKEKNPVVSARCKKLGIRCIQGCEEKLKMLQNLCADEGVPRSMVAYVGNDVNDVECLRWVGVAIAVADALPAAMESAAYITLKKGGQGAVREVCDWLLGRSKKG